MLDHIYTNITKQSIKSGVCIYEVSDHLPTFVIAKNTKCFGEKKIKFKRFMKHFILEDFLTDLDNKLSTYSIKLSDETNVNQDVLNLTSIFKKTLNKHVPMRATNDQKRKEIERKVMDYSGHFDFNKNKK